tara:strand:- start:5912 stop:7111 length:1200 start_codon:yes stop_codon:yes gene_type:complete
MSFSSFIPNVFAKKTFLSMVSNIRVGTLQIETSDGKTLVFKSPNPGTDATLIINDDSFYKKVVFSGEIGFGEAYQAGLCNSPDLVKLLQLALENRQSVNLNKGLLKFISTLKNVRLHRSRANTVEQSKHNIHDHYDLGNEFFSLFLDESMTYSSAVFSSDDQSLFDAQQNKYLKMCEAAKIKKNDHVLEIGTGWGGFAIFAAKTFGCKVTTITISNEQFNLAKARVKDAGLEKLISVNLIDYREITGTYDKIVSIEMFEAVGVEFFEVFFRKSYNSLREKGLLAMQVITVQDENYIAQKNGVNWIQKYIFPGGVLPSVEEMDRISKKVGLALIQTDSIGLDYAKTLNLWRQKFWENIGTVHKQGYDEHFIKTWDYYLAACEAGFLTANTDDVHIVFEKA